MLTQPILRRNCRNVTSGAPPLSAAPPLGCAQHGLVFSGAGDRVGGMFPRFSSLSLFVALLLVAPAVVGAKDLNNPVTQLAPINALLEGYYDGYESIDSLLQRGDFGLGTFDRLYGEMIVLDGVVYRAPVSGVVEVVPPDETTPWATVIDFAQDGAWTLPEGLTFDSLKAFADEKLPNQNLFVALRVDGNFARMKVRSVPAQEPPYKPLAEVVKNQKVFEWENVQGTLVGFRCPPYVSGLNVPGYHLHFISADRERGGHVLDFQLTRGELLGDVSSRYEVILPTGAAADSFADITHGEDRSAELHAIEN